jgi:Flp pilus assembly protein CpaB
MRASTLFGMTIAILIGMAVVFGVKTAGLFDKKPVPVVNQERPKILVAKKNLFNDTTISSLDEVMVRYVDESELDQFLKNKHRYLPAFPEAALLRVLTRPVYANEPLLKDYFQDLILPGAFNELLDPGMKAVNLEMPRERAGGGNIRKNDIVDVFLTTKITDHNGFSQIVSALIAPDLKVILKRNSIWTMLRSDDETKPIPFTIQANSYRAALIEFAKNHGYLTLTPTGPSNLKKKIGAMSFADDKDEEQRVFAVNTGSKTISLRDLEEIFKVSPTMLPPRERPQLIQTERWTGVIPRGGHTFFDREHGGAPYPAGAGFPNGQLPGSLRFSNPTASATVRWEKCDACPGGKRQVFD